MKKHFKLALVVIISLCSLSLIKSEPSNDIVEYYNSKQNKTLTELVDLTYKKEKVPLIYFYADWCRPCRVFEKNLKHKLVKGALKNASLIKINVDLDEQYLGEEFMIRYIPTFIKVNNKGEVIANIDASKWSKETPKHAAAVLEKLINSDTYDNK